MSKKLPIVIGLIFFPLLPVHDHAAAQIEKSPGCSIVRAGKPALFISYDSAGDDQRYVRLRINNNSTCVMVIETIDINPEAEAYKSSFKRQVTNVRGNLVVKYVFDPPREGVLIPVVYDHQDVANGKALEPGMSILGDIKFTLNIPADRSVIFQVRAEYLRKDFRIAVPFNYEWERGTGNEAAHHLYYYAQDLPPRVVLGTKLRN
ncbi:MAG: hypothetical protein ACJ741_18560 [Pyrinomonadaceae bacterium]